MKKKGEVFDSNTFSKKIPAEYLNLLKCRDSICSQPGDSIVFTNTTMSKYRNPISCFFVRKNYYLQVYKIDSSYKYPLTNAIKTSYDDISLPYYTDYHLDNFTGMEFLYKATKPEKAGVIYFNLSGENTKTLMKNDTVAYYFSKCNNFSLGFNHGESFDIYGQPKGGISKKAIDLEILFFKRQDNLFMLIFSAKDADVILNPGTLYKLFFK